LQVLSFDEDSDTALKKTNSAAEELINTLKKHKFPRESMEASDMQKHVLRHFDKDNRPMEIKGYEVTRSITIRLKALSSYAALMNDIVKLNNITRINTHFDISNRSEIEDTLVYEAGKDARAKAEKMISGLDSKISRVHAVYTEPSFFGASRSPYFHSDNIAEYDTPSYSNAAYMLAPSDITISKRLKVVFRLKD